MQRNLRAKHHHDAGGGQAEGFSGDQEEGGVVVGASDPGGELPAGPAITIPDVFATVMRTLGVNPAKVFTSNDRPIALANSGKPLATLF